MSQRIGLMWNLFFRGLDVSSGSPMGLFVIFQSWENNIVEVSLNPRVVNYLFPSFKFPSFFLLFNLSYILS